MKHLRTTIFFLFSLFPLASLLAWEIPSGEGTGTFSGYVGSEPKTYVSKDGKYSNVSFSLVRKNGDRPYKDDTVFVTVYLVKQGVKINDFQKKLGDHVTISGRVRPGKKGKVLAYLRVEEDRAKSELTDRAPMPAPNSAPVQTYSHVSERNQSDRVLSGKEIFANYSDAIVKVEIYHYGLLTNWGTGFFINDKGHFITNYHVIDQGLTDGFEVVVKNRQGKEYRNLTFSHCGDNQGLDLCLLSVDAKPTSWLRLKSHELSPGEKIYTIGHPQGFDYSISDGVLSSVQTQEFGLAGSAVYAKRPVKYFMVSTPISPGNSGGPLINERGEAIGVATLSYILKNSQNLNFGVHSDEVLKFLKQERPFLNITAFKGERQKLDQAIAVARRDAELKKVTDDFRTPGLAKKHFAAYLTKIGDQKLDVPIYKEFIPETCQHQVGKDGSSIFGNCRSPGNLSRFGFEVRKTTKKLSETYQQGKTIQGPALPIVAELKKRGRWEKIQKIFKGKEKSLLFGNLTVIKCATTPGGHEACKWVLTNASGIANAVEVGYSIELKDRPLTLDFSVWFQNPNLVEYYERISDVTFTQLAFETLSSKGPSRTVASVTEVNPGAKRAGAKIQLAALYADQVAHFADQGTYISSADKLAMKAPANSHYSYALVGDCKAKGLSFKKGAEPPQKVLERLQKLSLPCQDASKGFKAVAFGNLDGDEDLDVWTMDEGKKLIHLSDDLKP